MKTPIVNFVKDYKKKNFSRFHMPGHKGKKALGVEPLDITEIDGADVLYSPSSIILESENNATKLFGTSHTYYSTEGATLGIKTMLALVKSSGNGKTILAGRNAHKSFMHACALLDLNPVWLYPEKVSHICSCNINPSSLQSAINSCKEKPLAVYITSPDYLGNIADIKTISQICENEHIPLLVDNAHGAYSAFCNPSFHPIKLGATMCVDSAHKTLPVLTGGAYLHISKTNSQYNQNARSYLSMFASTSPSYLILQSLDMANDYLSKNSGDFDKTINKVNKLKLELIDRGYEVYSGEPLKLVINANFIGYTGIELAKILRKEKIEPEMADETVVVFMFSPKNTNKDFFRLKKALFKLELRQEIIVENIAPTKPKKALEIKDAMLAKRKTVKTSHSLGKILASTSISCPPAIPIAISGEIVDQDVILQLQKYGIDEIEIIE